MLDFPRWKYWLVGIVCLVGLLIASPNFFGEDVAIQIETKTRVPMDAAARSTVDAALAKASINAKREFIDSGRLIIAFADVATQLKARDVLDDPAITDVYRSALANASRAPAWMRALGLKPMPLGLDLRGGLYLLYQVDMQGAVSQMLGSYEQSYRHALTDAKIPYTDVQNITSKDSTFPDGLRIMLPPGADVAAAQSAVQKVDTNLVLSHADGAAGPTIDMVLTPAQIKTREDYALDQNRTTLANRVNLSGASEPIVQRQGLDRINVQLPGVQNSAEIKDLLGKVATLEFRMEDTQHSALEAQSTGRPPLGSKLYKTKDGQPILLKREVVVTGDELTSATATTSNEGPAVSINLDSRGGDAMLRNTRLNVGKPMAVVYIERNRKQVEVNGHKEDRETTVEKVINVATIHGVFSNQFQITGMSASESHDLSLLLRSGSLAAPIVVVEERAIGPSLGQENIDKGVRALIIGMAAVFVFMALYYQVFGLVADVVLLVNVVLLTALLSLVHASLSLPGIAGIILTVGMAVDANVLIYERIREELRNGVTPQAAIRAGFDRAHSAIIDSNVTALFAGMSLYVIGTGAIRGFAIVLVLGILTSLFTALWGSRALIAWIYGNRARVTKLAIG